MLVHRGLGLRAGLDCLALERLGLRVRRLGPQAVGIVSLIVGAGGGLGARRTGPERFALGALDLGGVSAAPPLQVQVLADCVI